MEAINTLAHTAAKAVWGNSQSTEEPISGKTGDVAHGEPYDAGNIGEPGESTGATSNKRTGTTSGAGVSAGAYADDEPNEELGSSSVTRGDSSKAQGDVRTPTYPQADPGSARSRARANVDDAGQAGEGQSGGQGGSVGAGSRAGGSGGAGAAAAGGEEVQNENKGESAGEKYIKSSGVKADGGDFDAADSGAGREADRLLDENGVHREGADVKSKAKREIKSETRSKARSDASGGSHGGGSKASRSLSEKIKSKLHMRNSST